MMFDEKNETGVLINRGYKPGAATKIYDLLHDLPLEDWVKPETFEALAQDLRSPRVAIAELAFSHLLGPMSRGKIVELIAHKKLPLFNAADPLEQRRAFAARINELVSKKELPPSPTKKPGE